MDMNCIDILVLGWFVLKCGEGAFSYRKRPPYKLKYITAINLGRHERSTLLLGPAVAAEGRAFK